MKNKSITNNAESFVEHDQLSEDYQQQILDLNLRQLKPALTKDNSFSQVFTAAIGDRIIISNLPSTPAHNTSKFCDKISIEVTSTNENSIALRLTISNKAFFIEEPLPVKN